MNTFEPFPKIARLDSLPMVITQKLHGTNAQIFIDGTTIQAGSRNRWITPTDDNFGFASFVEENKEALIAFLGNGRHFGEWCGPGINSGEGLSQKTFFLFDNWKYENRPNRPNRVEIVPVLYSGPISSEAITESLNILKTEGSKASPGFMRPEGIVVNMMGTRYKKVFQAEETQWKQAPAKEAVSVDVAALLQPIRLEKLLSRDERLLVGLPATTGDILKLYMEDLEAEGFPVPKEARKHVASGVRAMLGEYSVLSR